MSETPLFEELEAKWSETDNYRTICDRWWTVTHIATGQHWLEDDEGNEVFPETQYAEGGIVKGSSPEVQRLLENFDNDCPVALVPKRKFKLFGRNQGTNGTL